MQTDEIDEVVMQLLAQRDAQEAQSGEQPDMVGEESVPATVTSEDFAQSNE
jgi:hypothetical protein